MSISLYLSVLISCSENTKNVLLSCAFIHLEKKEFIKQFAEISSINQRILLSGPAGTYFVSVWRPVLPLLFTFSHGFKLESLGLELWQLPYFSRTMLVTILV